jgi:hypothetical protein
MSNSSTTDVKEALINLLQERKVLKEKEKYLASDCWAELKQEIDVLKKEIQQNRGRIETNDMQLAELIDLLNEELDVEEANMYM